jgi:hypothetical protein
MKEKPASTLIAYKSFPSLNCGNVTTRTSLALRDMSIKKHSVFLITVLETTVVLVTRLFVGEVVTSILRVAVFSIVRSAASISHVFVFVHGVFFVQSAGVILGQSFLFSPSIVKRALDARITTADLLVLFQGDLGSVLEPDLVRSAFLLLAQFATASATRRFGVGIPGGLTVALTLVVFIRAGFIRTGFFLLFLIDVLTVGVGVGAGFGVGVAVHTTILLFVVNNVAPFPVTLSESSFDLLPGKVDLAIRQPGFTPTMHWRKRTSVIFSPVPPLSG